MYVSLYNSAKKKYLKKVMSTFPIFRHYYTEGLKTIIYSQKAGVVNE
jgi:hypothetical protein